MSLITYDYSKIIIFGISRKSKNCKLVLKATRPVYVCKFLQVFFMGNCFVTNFPIGFNYPFYRKTIAGGWTNRKYKRGLKACLHQAFAFAFFCKILCRKRFHPSLVSMGDANARCKWAFRLRSNRPVEVLYNWYYCELNPLHVTISRWGVPNHLKLSQ